MTISMYKTSVPIFVQFLTSLSAVLDKAAAFAEAKKIEPSVLLNMRLAPDMLAPLRHRARQARLHGHARVALTPRIHVSPYAMVDENLLGSRPSSKGGKHA